MHKVISIGAAAVLVSATQLPSTAQDSGQDQLPNPVQNQEQISRPDPIPVQNPIQSKKNYIGPVVYFVNGISVVGAVGKIGVFDRVSIRPALGFAGGNTAWSASATYDFNLSGQSPIQLEPFAGVGVVSNSGVRSSTITYAQLGTDIGLGDSFILTGDLKFSLSGGSGVVAGIGTGLRF